MKRDAALNTLALSFVVAVALPAAAGANEAWDYEHGTEHWSFLDDDYAKCSAGLQQSPIDVIRDNATERTLTPLRFHYADDTALDVASPGNGRAVSKRGFNLNRPTFEGGQCLKCTRTFPPSAPGTVRSAHPRQASGRTRVPILLVNNAG